MRSGLGPWPAVAWHWRTASLVRDQRSGVEASAWSVIDQKSSPEQNRAKSQASATGCAPLPPFIGSDHRKASVE